ncbi:MAG: response regulator receiver protein, partial [Candidatus Methanoperedens sp.]|nr:response regulator receiver protein [Candidatus Methanoperedens sp.]
GKHLSAAFNVASSEKNKIVEDPVAKVIREGSFYGLSDQTILITKNNMEIPIDLIGTPIMDEKNDIIGVILVFYDIIERKQKEEALKRSTGSFLS